MNVLRTFLDSENANANRIHMRTEALIAEVGAFREFAGFSELIRNAINFMNSVLPQENSSMSEFFTSHEALLLNYEEAFARQRPRNRSIPSSGAGEWYVGSGHMLWIGDRTRQPDGAHIEFLRGVANPIGIKCGPTLKPDELIRLLEVLNPQNEAGKITLISRMGHQKIQESLPPLIQRVRNEGRAVVWSCDPMHGNTYTSPNGLKTRQFTHILDELKGFFIIHDAEGSLGGGVHLELSGKSVTECIGGNEDVKYENLIEGNYTSLCDPRLNDRQAVELAFRLALFFSENPVKAR
jgi:3-deoxy-7-phosphoheptulonate synthase